MRSTSKENEDKKFRAKSNRWEGEEKMRRGENEGERKRTTSTFLSFLHFLNKLSFLFPFSLPSLPFLSKVMVLKNWILLSFFLRHPSSKSPQEEELFLHFSPSLLFSYIFLPSLLFSYTFLPSLPFPYTFLPSISSSHTFLLLLSWGREETVPARSFRFSMQSSRRERVLPTTAPLFLSLSPFLH